MKFLHDPRDFSSLLRILEDETGTHAGMKEKIIGSCVFYTDSGNRIYLYSEYSMFMIPTMDFGICHNTELFIRKLML